jgi:hypothetical protein
MISTNRLRDAMHAITAKRGPFTLFALVMRTESIGMWDLVVSASWIEAARLKELKTFVELLTEAIGTDALKSFARVVTLPSSHPAVRFLVDNVPVEDGEVRMKSTDLSELEIEEVIVLRAVSGARRRSARKPDRASVVT